MQEDEFIEIDFILGLLKPNAQKLFNEIILARKNKMWSTTIVFCLAILDNIFNDDEYLKLGVKMPGPETIFFSNDTLTSSVLKFWNWSNSFRYERLLKSIK